MTSQIGNRNDLHPTGPERPHHLSLLRCPGRADRGLVKRRALVRVALQLRNAGGQVIERAFAFLPAVGLGQGDTTQLAPLPPQGRALGSEAGRVLSRRRHLSELRSRTHPQGITATRQDERARR